MLISRELINYSDLYAASVEICWERWVCVEVAGKGGGGEKRKMAGPAAAGPEVYGR